jgi:hypothetical protein
LNVIQDIIYAIFEFIYFEQSRISKFTLYIILKFVILFFLERYGKLKDRCRMQEKTTKYNQLKATIDERKMVELRDKAQGKI